MTLMDAFVLGEIKSLVFSAQARGPGQGRQIRAFPAARRWRAMAGCSLFHRQEL